jgi:hypothetical protein
MTETRDHVVRESVPWRDEQLTQCGRPISDVGSVISEDELRRRLKKDGQQRTAFTVCMTCYHHPHSKWDTDPVGVIRNDRTGYARTHYASPVAIGQPPRDMSLVHELHAIAKLVETHQDEFDQLVEEEKLGAAWQDRLAKRRKA